MHKQIILLFLLLLLPLSVYLQPFISEGYCKPDQGSVQYHGVDPFQEVDFGKNNCSSPSINITLSIMTRQIDVSSEAYYVGNPADNNILPYWLPEVEERSNDRAVLKFMNTVSGDMCWLAINSKMDKLFVTEAIQIEMNSIYNIFFGEEYGNIPFRSVKLSRRHMESVINNKIAFTDYFSKWGNEYEVYRCPAGYPIDDCIKKMEEGYEFKLKDFEEEGEDYSYPDSNIIVTEIHQ